MLTDCIAIYIIIVKKIVVWKTKSVLLFIQLSRLETWESLFSSSLSFLSEYN